VERQQSQAKDTQAALLLIKCRTLIGGGNCMEISVKHFLIAQGASVEKERRCLFECGESSCPSGWLEIGSLKRRSPKTCGAAAGAAAPVRTG